VAEVPKHDCEQKGECYDCKVAWVYLLVARRSVGADHLLEGIGELICLYFSRRGQIVSLYFVELRRGGLRFFGDLLE
jgi:hypothetical protein